MVGRDEGILHLGECNLKVREFKYNVIVKDGFDCDNFKMEVEVLLEGMGHSLLDFAFKKDGFILPPSAPVSMKCFDTIKFQVEGIGIDSMIIHKNLHQLAQKLDTLKIYGGSFVK